MDSLLPIVQAKMKSQLHTTLKEKAIVCLLKSILVFYLFILNTYEKSHKVCCNFTEEKEKKSLA